MPEIHISFFSAGLPSYIKEMFALSVRFPKLFGMLRFSLLWVDSFYTGSVFCPFSSPSNNSKCLLSRHLQLMQIDASILISWYPSYSLCLSSLPGKKPFRNLFSPCCLPSFWSGFPPLTHFFSVPRCYGDIILLCAMKVVSEFITESQLTVKEGVWTERFENTLCLSRQSW